MLDVFLSRPTRVTPDFVQGLEQFERLLRTMGLGPRTLGTSDYPTRCPLDEVIRLLDECHGAVILGYPQVVVTSGLLLNEPVLAPLTLATEWNHIEAGLAYARDLPLLVIHHAGVTRGIFDRGAISSFLYQVDFSDPNWPLSQPISGALQTWKSGVLEPRGRDGDASRGRGARRRKPLTDDLVKVLETLAQSGHEKLDAASVARILCVVEQKALHFLDELSAADLVDDYVVVGRPARYYLTPAGRAALVERGIL